MECFGLVWYGYQSKDIQILNISFPRVGIEPTVSSLLSHARVRVPQLLLFIYDIFFFLFQYFLI